MKPVARFTRLNATQIAELTRTTEKVQEYAEVEDVIRVKTKPFYRKNPRSLNNKGPYDCDLCESICKSRQSMYSHMKYRHIKAPRWFCDLCPKSFKMKYLLADHLHSHIKIKYLVCDVCGFKSHRKRYLKGHKLTHEKKSECPVCKKLVTSIRMHMQDVHKKVPCKVCGKKMRKSCLKDHVRKIHGKNHRCAHEKCKEAFARKIDLNR